MRSVEDDLGVATTGKPLVEVQKDGVRIGVIVQLHDKSGKSIDALGLMYPYKSGESNTSFLARSGVIRDQLAKQIPSVDAFPNGRPKLPSGVISPYNEEAEVNGRWTAPARRTGHEGIMQKGDTENPSFRSVDLTPAKAPSRFMSVIGVASGNSLEMYDFMIFGYYAKWIARAFFPLHNPVSSLLLTLATFGAGFLMRPLGAVLLGGYTDRHGRRAGLLLTLSLMAVGTATIALTPSYSTIGLIAPLIVVTGRLLQGLSAGAELGTASVYLAEIAPEGWKGLYVSLQSASQQVAVMAAAILGILLAKYLPEDSLDRWGWRLPLVVGCALIPFLFWIRQSMAETSPLSKRVLSGRQVLSSLAQNWRIVLIATFFTALTTTAFYFITVYTLTFGVSELRLASRDALTVTLFVGLLNVIVLPLMGRVSDSLGRRALLWPASVCFLISAYPAIHWLVAGPSFGRLMAVELWFAFLYASYNAAMVVYLTEIMPPEVRATSFSLAYSMATALFGGFTPFVCTYVIKETGNKAAPGLWLSFAALVAVCAVTLTYVKRSLVSRSSYSWETAL